MRPRIWGRAGAGFVGAAVAASALASCGGSEPAASPTGSPSAAAQSASAAPAATGPVYTAPANLCDAVDFSALADILPKDGGRPIADGPGLCGTSRSSSAVTVTLTVDANLFEAPKQAQGAFEGLRREALGPVTDIPGAGTAAAWASDGAKMELFAYHGNLFLVVDAAPLRKGEQLPEGLPERLVRVADSVFDNLSP